MEALKRHLKWNWLLLAVAVAAFTIFGAVSVALAQTCIGRAAALEKLESFGESQVAMGLTLDGTMMAEVFASPDGKTWTWVMSTPEGLTCIIAAGENWRMRTAAPGEEGPGI